MSDGDALSALDRKWREIRDENNIPENEAEKVSSRIVHASRNGEYDKIKDIADEVEEELGVDMSKFRSYADILTDDDLVEVSDTEDELEEMSDVLRQAIKQQLTQADSKKMIVRTEEPVMTSHLYQLMKDMYKEQEKMVFPIAAQREWEGRISVSVSSTKKNVQLMEVYDTENGYKFRHLGQSRSGSKGNKQVDEHTHGFFIYKFISDATEYLLFSTERLDPQSCKVKGMKLDLSDYQELGENTGIKVDTKVIIAHSVEPAIEPLTNKGVEELAEEVDHDWLGQRLLGDWRHPEWFEKMLLSIAFTNEEHGYPSGMLWMAPTGTGKSKVMEALTKAFGENHGVFSGTSSTVKGLTPSFSEKPPDEGYLLKTQRVAGVDEVFNLLQNAAASGEASMKDAFRPLLDLIEHHDRTYESGNGTLRGKMEGVMIGAGNDSYGITSMSEAADTLDEAFLGRFLLYDQIESHIDFVEERKYEIDEQDAEFPDGDEDFISLVDTLRGHRSVLPERGRVKSIKTGVEEMVPSNFDDIFRARADHHIKNLVSGHAKYRSLVEGTLDFEAKDEDYEFAREVMEILVNSWINREDLEDMKKTVRPYFLPVRERKIYDAVRQDHPMTQEELKDEVGGEVAYDLKEVMDLDLIVKDDGMLYPYYEEPKDNRKFKSVKGDTSSKGEHNDT